MKRNPQDLEKIAHLTLEHYNQYAEEFWQIGVLANDPESGNEGPPCGDPAGPPGRGLGLGRSAADNLSYTARLNALRRPSARTGSNLRSTL
jgi:hypothetical protein